MTRKVRIEIEYKKILNKQSKLCTPPNKKSRTLCRTFLLVPKTGFEPARRFQRYHLKVVRLPISPPGHLFYSKTKNNVVYQSCLPAGRFATWAGRSAKLHKKGKRGKGMILNYFFSRMLNVVPFPGSELATKSLPPW